MESQDTLESLFLSRTLPSDVFVAERKRLVLPKRIRHLLARYVQLIALLQERGVAESPLSGLIIFTGPPGVGKTVTAHVLADVIARRYLDLSGKRTVFLECRLANLLREMLGKTSKAIADAFEMVSFSAERKLTIVLADELESLAFQRARLSPGDPSDVVRGVNEFLKQLDLLQGCPNFICIGTTNLAALLDEALIDRADCIVEFGYPDAASGAAILRGAAARARRIGISLTADDAREAAEALCGNGQQISGRLLSKLPLLAVLQTGAGRLSARDLCEAASRVPKLET
jgi:ATP-dependent 26S proteasome regulatory subunit